MTRHGAVYGWLLKRAGSDGCVCVAPPIAKVASQLKSLTLFDPVYLLQSRPIPGPT